jgi:hypothetical protein
VTKKQPPQPTKTNQPTNQQARKKKRLYRKNNNKIVKERGKEIIQVVKLVGKYI